MKFETREVSKSVDYYSSMLIVIPAIIFATLAQSAVSATFSKYSQVRSGTGYTGKQLARMLLDSHGLSAITIEPVQGVLSDHFDPKQRVVRLSESTFQNSSVASLGVVAHEVGHVMQMQEKYAPMLLRNAVVPVAQFGSSFSWLIFFGGLFLSIPLLIQVGIGLFLSVVAFSLVTLPVEFNASRRALNLLQTRVLMSQDELSMVKKVLNAAAMTYVASTLMAVLNLVRMLMISRRSGD